MNGKGAKKKEVEIENKNKKHSIQPKMTTKTDRK